MNTKTIFFLLLILSATGFISPPIALCAGLIFGLAFVHPFAGDSRALSRFLLQASVVALGFGMNLHEVLKAGRSGFLYTAIGIGFALLMGTLIGKLLAVCWHDFLFDLDGHGNLWRKRDRRSWADIAGQR